MLLFRVDELFEFRLRVLEKKVIVRDFCCFRGVVIGVVGCFRVGVDLGIYVCLFILVRALKVLR